MCKLLSPCVEPGLSIIPEVSRPPRFKNPSGRKTRQQLFGNPRPSASRPDMHMGVRKATRGREGFPRITHVLPELASAVEENTPIHQTWDFQARSDKSID